jgi:cation diffusion facilitator CzcD-associated flavoprotein CzcO
VRRQLLPDYRLGCKRVLSANDYYPTFNRDNVDLVTGAVERVTATGVVGSDGVERAADVIIYATGFRVNESFAFVDLRGRDGSTLWEQFSRDGIETYLGINVVNFPNLCVLLGPNTALGHHSVVFMIEQQTAYVVRLLDAMDARGARSVEVRPQAQQRYNDEIQTKLARGIWSTGGCTSWYLDATGRNRTIWPGLTVSYWWRTRRLDTKAYTWRRTGGLTEQSARSAA